MFLALIKYYPVRGRPACFSFRGFHVHPILRRFPNPGSFSFPERNFPKVCRPLVGAGMGNTIGIPGPENHGAAL
jgi:hypothetical protein